MGAEHLRGPIGAAANPHKGHEGASPKKLTTTTCSTSEAMSQEDWTGGTKRRWGGMGEDQPNPPEDTQGANKRAKAQEGQLLRGSKPSPLTGMTLSSNANLAGKAGLRGTQTSAQHSGTKPSIKRSCLLLLL